MPVYLKRSPLPVSPETAFAWHTRAGALERLIPPWQRVRILSAEPLAEGSRTVLELRRGPFRARWVARHRDIVPGASFTDELVSGPFARWVHVHRFLLDGDVPLVEDRVEWAPRLPIASLLASAIDRTFSFRHARLSEDLARHATADLAPMRIAVTGASGMIGSALVPFLTTGGHRVDRLVRRGTGGIAWDPEAGTVDVAALEGVDAIVHLAGENIGAGRWTEERKRAILQSRVRGTGLVARTAARLVRRPRVLVTASAVGFYGDGTTPVDESSPPGSGFLADVVRAWEEAVRPAQEAGIRVVRVRAGVVLSARGGVLGRLRLPFWLGLGGPIGSGEQAVSWIGIDDLLDVFHLALADRGLAGPVNAVAPRPTTNGGLVASLGRVLRRPTVLPMPALLVRTMFGEMGQELLLSGQSVLPGRLQERGFRWRAPTLEEALGRELGAWPRS